MTQDTVVDWISLLSGRRRNDNSPRLHLQFDNAREHV